MSEFTLMATGDLGPNRENPGSIFDNVRDVLSTADLLFGQLEPCMASTGSPAAQCRLPMRCNPSGADAIRSAGYDIISFATNHCMDWGREAFYETCDAMSRAGMDVVGAGGNIFEARKPVIKEIKGTTIGFLAYNSILPQDYWANEERPGCNPMRAITAAQPIEHDQPQTPVRLFSFPHPDDLENMLADIRELKEQVDLVAVSFHWGIHFVPEVLADYQKYVAHFAIDEGADIILGHHTHILKGIEVYKGKPVIYSMANFALEGPERFFEGKGKLTDSKQHKDIAALNSDTRKNSKRTMPEDSFKTIIVKCVFENKKIKKVSYIPAIIDENYNPHVFQPGDSGFKDVCEYMKKITASQKLNTQFTIEGNEVNICL